MNGYMEGAKQNEYLGFRVMDIAIHAILQTVTKLYMIVFTKEFIT